MPAVHLVALCLCVCRWLLFLRVASSCGRSVVTRYCYLRIGNARLLNMQEDEAVAANPGSTEQLSFRERMQRFNRMASETDLQGRPNGNITPTKKRSDKVTETTISFSNTSITICFSALERLTEYISASHFLTSLYGNHDNYFADRPRNYALYLFTSLTNKLRSHSFNVPRYIPR